MYCRPTTLWLRARHHLCNLELCWISSSINLNFRVVYYEVVYIIVRYDVCDHFLILLASRTLPLILVSLDFVHWLGAFGSDRPLIYYLGALVWVLLQAFAHTTVVVRRGGLVIEVQNFCFRRFSDFG